MSTEHKLMEACKAIIAANDYDEIEAAKELAQEAMGGVEQDHDRILKEHDMLHKMIMDLTYVAPEIIFIHLERLWDYCKSIQSGEGD